MITLDENFRIEQDTHSLMLVETIKYKKIEKNTKKETGEIGLKDKKTYHPNLASVLNEYIKRSEINLVADEIIIRLQEVIDNYKILEKKINHLKSVYKIE